MEFRGGSGREGLNTGAAADIFEAFGGLPEADTSG
jgi:hypothetical protein